MGKIKTALSVLLFLSWIIFIFIQLSICHGLPNWVSHAGIEPVRQFEAGLRFLAL